MPYSEYSWQSILLTGLCLLPLYIIIYPLSLTLKKQPSRGVVLFIYIYPYISTLLFLYGYTIAAIIEGKIVSTAQQVSWIIYYIFFYIPIILIINVATKKILKKKWYPIFDLDKLNEVRKETHPNKWHLHELTHEVLMGEVLNYERDDQ